MRSTKIFHMIIALSALSILSCNKNDSPPVTPLVTATNPTNNLTGVARNIAIAFSFNEAMNPSTINDSTFTLMQGSTPIPGTVTYSGTTAVFTPVTVLAVNNPYTVTMSTGVKNLAGNSLTTSTVSSFTTGGSATTLSV